MQPYTAEKFSRILRDNGFSLNRVKGSHYIYTKEGHNVTVPIRLNACIANRLIKENGLVTSRRSSKSFFMYSILGLFNFKKNKDE